MQLKPIMMVENQNLKSLENDKNFERRNHSMLIPESQLRETIYNEPHDLTYSRLHRKFHTGRTGKLLICMTNLMGKISTGVH